MSKSMDMAPVLDGNLRSHYVRLPEEAQSASGIRILGRNIKSIAFTTDLAIIRNCDADAIFAVYPFTPQEVILRTIAQASSLPVLAGVGGGTTGGMRSAILAKDAEAAGAYGVVLNAPSTSMTVEMVSRIVDIPVIVTVIDDDPLVVESRLESGASVINVAAGRDTPSVVAKLRRKFPGTPFMATGGKTGASVAATVSAGANAVVCTPPTSAELFSPMMGRYRASVENAGAHLEARPLSETARAEAKAEIERLRNSALIVP